MSELLLREDIRDDDDIPSNPSTSETIGDLIVARYSRRQALKGMSAVAAVTALGSLGSLVSTRQALAASPSSLTFDALPHGVDDRSHVAPGYEVQTLIRWGDPVESGAPDFDPSNQSAHAQARQWGYNNDYVAFMPLPKGSDTADHGLLCVNFEYTNAHLMFPGLKKGELDKLTKDQVDVELAAHGHGVIEIRRDGETGAWAVVKESPLARRLNALETEFRLSGPAAGSDRLKTSTDDSGTKVVGTLNNCAGGKTPWNTILLAEENFHQYFGGDPSGSADAGVHKRVGIEGDPKYAWHRFYDRFDVEKEPNESNKFGWMVEFDPYDPQSVPVKRTSLGRFKHEGATTTVNKDGRVVIYSGDDQRFDYVYKFVTNGTFDAANPEASRDFLDDGTLYVAKFHADGKLDWMPLVHGQGPLTEENGFASQADVLIETRRAADLLGATPMDRPEDVEPNPATGIVYMALTNNTRRKEDGTDAANPRGPNKYGHVVEMIPPGSSAADRDHAAEQFTWDIFLLCGPANDPEVTTRYHSAIGENGWLSCPDNVAFDTKGRIWIATDGMELTTGFADGVYAADTQGEGRALTKQFYRTPIGAELCGPEFNTDCTAYFAAVQHPGDTKDSTFDAPATRWPDFKEGVPPRPSLQVIVKSGGGEIGS